MAWGQATSSEVIIKKRHHFTSDALWKKLRTFFKKAVPPVLYYPRLFLWLWFYLIGVFLPSVVNFLGLFSGLKTIFFCISETVSGELSPLISKFESWFLFVRRLIKVVLNYQTSLLSGVITWMGDQIKLVTALIWLHIHLDVTIN